MRKKLFDNGTWAIDEVFNKNHGKYDLHIYSDEMSIYDTMIRYGHNNYAFDYADRIPDKIRSIAKRISETDEKYLLYLFCVFHKYNYPKTREFAFFPFFERNATKNYLLS